MGTDIHASLEYKDNNEWHAVMWPNGFFGKFKDELELTARIPFPRNYFLFAVLGNVRNGYGFAGIFTHEEIVPISDNRGIPIDVSKETLKILSEEHSPTWVSLTEILNYDWNKKNKIHR